MKKLVFLSLVVVVLFVLGGCGQAKYVPTKDEVYYGIWTNKEMKFPRLIHYSDGTFEDYSSVSGVILIDGGTSEIFKKWTDSEGNVWYNCYDIFTKGNIRGMKAQTLWKISKSGTVGEFVVNAVGTFDPNGFPTTVDQHRYDEYYIYSRAEK